MYATSTHAQNSHIPHYNPHMAPNGHAHHPPPPQTQLQRTQPPPIPKEPVTVVGIPSVSIQNNRLVVGNSQSSSTRSYTRLKILGDGSFGTVWLCDWHGTLPPNTPLSPMQCGAGARPEWTGKRLVAVKRMKKKWEGGWDECQKLKELESLRAIPFHPNIIPLYDFFLLPDSKELYFVFESMEGNLYHLIKARKGRALAGGLVSSIFQQIVQGLDHIHTAGYFHRDMKPENVLVTTTGLHDYNSISPIAPPNAPKERDVVAIIKLADFGLARETKSNPPYTEYVSTRWYRAPEVLLLSHDYSNPVDMWALGTIMAELVNLRPLFPGSDQLDQVGRICQILGDPSDAYGLDSHSGGPLGGGPWPRGIRMAKEVGYQFSKTPPIDIHTLFQPTVPRSLVRCIRDLLRYDPDARLTSRQCRQHPYLLETIPRNNIPIPSGLRISTTTPHQRNGHNTMLSPSPRSPHPNPSPNSPHPRHQNLDGAPNHRSPFAPPSITLQTPSPNSSGILHPSQSASWHSSTTPTISQNGDDLMDISPQAELPEEYHRGQPMDIHGSPMVQEYPARPQIEPENNQAINGHPLVPTPASKLGKLGSLSFGKKNSKWSLGMFGSDKSHHLPPLDEIPAPPSSTPSLKRTQSSSTDSRSLRELSPVQESPVRNPSDVKKNNKKEAERVQREAEKQRRKLAEKMHREQARAVMQKREKMIQKGNDIEWHGGNKQRLEFSETASKGKISSSGPIRQSQPANVNTISSTTLNAAAGRFSTQAESSSAGDWRGANERVAKARRREFDDDHSMSSSDVHSIGRMSSISFATVDSDPGPSRIRNRPSLFGINRMTSMSSLRTSFDDFPTSARSSNSFSLEGQLAHDFRTQASINTTHLGSVSPPPIQMLSLSPSVSPSLSPSPPWIQVQQHKERLLAQREHSPPYIVPPSHPNTHLSQNGTYSFEFGGQPPTHPPSPYGHPPSPGNAPKSAINPIFHVHRPPSTGDSYSPATSLPPFSQLEAVAGGGEYPPLSPMSFHASSEDT